jgi:ATP-dependent helicase/nuclease subunit B
MINVAAERATQELALSESEFLPFAAIWPRVREGYLAWLAEHEATGAVFDVGEASLSMPLGRLTLIGKIDRMDRQSDGHALLIDYKTESRSTTAERIKSGQEDTQLAFYAALIEDDTLAAAYVNLGEKEPTKTYAQPDIVGLRDELIEGIRDDMARLEQGAALPALGEGKACDYCAARGLCRKDFWK